LSASHRRLNIIHGFASSGAISGGCKRPLPIMRTRYTKQVQCLEEISIIAQQILDILRKEYCPSERIPSEREWAERLHYSHNRVHRALRKLALDGVIWSSGNRRGNFMADVTALPSRPRRKVELKLYMPVDLQEKSTIYLDWCRVCDMFHVSHPSVTVKIIEDREDADVIMTWPPLMDIHDLQALEPEKIVETKDLLPGICNAGVFKGKCYGIPFLHTPACFWGHRNLLARYDCHVSEFREPLDFFRWGNKLNNASECASGFTFCGFNYHAPHWGVEFKRKGEVIFIDREPLEAFLDDVYGLIPLNNVQYTPFNNYKIFHRGQQALMCGFLHDISLSEHRFVMLGQPLKPNGYANQTAFMLSATKQTKHLEDVFDLMRFSLTKVVQKLFFMPVAYFSARKDLYEEEYQTLSAQTDAIIPRFDLRGYFLGLLEDLWIASSNFYYQQCAACLAQQIRRELAIERMLEVNIQQLRTTWLHEAPYEKIRMLSSYARSIAAELNEPVFWE